MNDSSPVELDADRLLAEGRAPRALARSLSPTPTTSSTMATSPRYGSPVVSTIAGQQVEVRVAMHKLERGR